MSVMSESREESKGAEATAVKQPPCHTTHHEPPKKLRREREKTAKVRRPDSDWPQGPARDGIEYLAIGGLMQHKILLFDAR